VNVLLFILGAVAVIMIVIGGIKYTTSNGDASSVTSAKNTIMYAVVGLIVALMAYAIVNFVIQQFV
jgi:multisubunit Na+/H+ antiporter MnhB subunit